MIMKGIDVLKIRENLGLNQKEFGELIGVDRRTIINYEQGKPIPASRVKLLELMLSNGIGDRPNEKISLTHKKREPLVDVDEDLRREILDLKDHIKTLKEFIDEKNKLSEMYINENTLLKEKIAILEANSGG